MTAAFTTPRVSGLDAVEIGRVAVIGAGPMGAGIAAQFANAGIGVDLLDIPGPASSRSAPAVAGIDRQLKAGGFMHPVAAGLIRPGNIEDDMARLAQVDWIVEAVVERLDIKRDLFRRIDAIRRPGTIVSSNTSTIPRSALVEGQSDAFDRDFTITHFFNPPRVMPLVEIVSGSSSDPALVERVRRACATVLGKTVIDCRDTPGFIANRIGCYWLAASVIEAVRMGLEVEEADAAMAALGIPRTGAFGLMDLVGIDLVPQVWGSLMQALPQADPIQAHDLTSEPVIVSMIAEKHFGRKAKSGFYRLTEDRRKQALDLRTHLYRDEHAVPASALPGGGRDMVALLDADTASATYAWKVLALVVDYAARTAPDIAADVGAIDAAMKLGYGWREGPFELVQRYGVAKYVARRADDGAAVPPILLRGSELGAFYDGDGRPLSTDGVGRGPSRATAYLSGATRLAGNDAATLHDIGDGVACFEMHTKMNSFAPGVFDMLEEALRRGGHDFAALVIGNENPRAFSAGADLTFIANLIRTRDVAALDSYIARGQDLFLRLKYAPFPVVAAMHGLALGGGCEFGLHADAIVAHAELNAGLPEVKVGLVPGWGGCTQLLLRAQSGKSGPKGPAAEALRTFETIFLSRTSTSALDAAAIGYLRATDEIVMDRSDLLSAARRRAAAMAANGYEVPDQALLKATGPSGKAGLMRGVQALHAAASITATDFEIAEVLATVLSGGPGGDPMIPETEAMMMALERQAIVALSQSPATAARIAHMLEGGKPLRN